MGSGILATLSNDLASEIERVTNLIMQICPVHDCTLVEQITAHIMKAGGKRLRPMLTLASAKLCGAINNNHVMLAAAVELIHTATLLHDDVIDQSMLRRGADTSNAIWGNKASILVGDYLFSHAFQFMVKTELMPALALLSEVSSIIAEAEILQLQFIGNLNITQNQYFDLITAKTAALFAAACSVGGIASYASTEQTQYLYQYGLNLGIVFQIIDDLLDYIGNSTEFGKKIGNDLLESKATLPLLLLYNMASKAECKQIEILFRAQDTHVVENNWNILLSMIEKYQVYDITLNHALKVAHKGIMALEKFPESMYRTMMTELLLESVKRKE